MTCDDAGLIGVSASMTRVREDVDLLQASDMRVLITGDKAVNKAIVARAIHRGSPRALRPFVHVNCQGLSADALLAAFFSTDDPDRRTAPLWLPDQGTLFLDDVVALSDAAQRLLLNALDPTDEASSAGRRAELGTMRLIAAADRTLGDRLARGLFLEPLFYRLNVIHLIVPPLRERPEDVAALVEHFLAQQPVADTPRVAALSDRALDRLRAHSWPGDLRELADVIEHVVLSASSEVADADDLPAYLQAPEAPEEQRPASGSS